jgi:hypothetical protein
VTLKIAKAAGWLLAFAWVAFVIHYVVDSRAMFSPYGDLGGEIFSTGALAAGATSLRNVLSLIGWQPWDNSSFWYLTMGEYFISVPLQLVLHDPFKAEKLVIALQLSVAFIATAALGRELLGRSPWRWFAAACYVLLPLMSLQTRLIGFGWVAALAPAALAVNLRLMRRFGAAAVPAVGVVCALSSVFFDVEYGIFTGLPLLALSFAILRWQGFSFRWWHVLTSVAAFALFPAYTVLVTVFGHRLFDWISPVQAVPSQLALFSQSVVSQIANILREAITSPDPAFNASPSLSYAIAGGALLWLLAIVGLGYALADGTWRRWWPVALIAAACLLLSFGTTVPLIGPPLWNAVAHLPLLQALRTPDRFEQIDALLVVICAAYGASRLAHHRRIAGIAVAAAAFAIVASLFTFDVREHVLALQRVQDRLPDFGAVTRAVERIGGRTAVLGFPTGGSQYDWAPYAPSAARIAAAWDLAGRYAGTDAGVAILRRAAVRSIVTTPDWTRLSESGMPADLGDVVARSVYAKALGPFPSGANVFAIDARPMLASVRPLCTLGGPAAFEIAAGMRTFDDDAFVHGSKPGCDQTLFADYDPRDAAVPSSAVAAWSGEEAFGKSEPLPPPNVFEVDRFGIAVHWYRNQYRGDSLVSDAPFLTYGYKVSQPLTFTIARASTYALYARVSGLATMQTGNGRGRDVFATSRRVQGFNWVELDLGALRPGTYRRSLEVIPAPESDMPAVIDLLAVAPARVSEPANLHPALTLVSMRAFEPPIGIRHYQYVFPRPQGGALTPQGQGIVRMDPWLQVGLSGAEARLSAIGRSGRAEFRWNGPSGDYVVTIAGWLNEQAPTMRLSTGGQTLVARYDPSIGIAPTLAYARMSITRGAPLDLALQALPGGTAVLTQLTVMPVQAQETPTAYDGSSETWEFGSNDPMQFYEAIHSSQVAVAAGTIRAFNGAVATIPFDPVFAGGLVTASLEVGGGKGAAVLRCGDASDASAMGSGSENPGGASLAVARPGHAPCVLAVRWDSETLALKSVRIHATGPAIAGWSASQYFAAGRYLWSSPTTHGVTLAVNGRVWPRGQARDLASGTHVLTLVRAPAGMAPLLFSRLGIAPVPMPPQISVTQHSATSWNVHAAGATTLELAMMDDGNWYARMASGTTFGYRCDLINTCFDVPAAGDVYVSHRLPPLLALGLAITFADLAAAVVALLAAELARRRGVASRPLSGSAY